MRLRDQVASLGEDIRQRFSDQNQSLSSVVSQLQRNLDRYTESISAEIRKQPLQVRLSRKQVDQVIQRFSDPLVFPREITEFIAGDIAKHGNVFYQWQMSYHPLGFTAEVEFRTDGTMKLSFSDANGQRFWTGVWHGVDG